MAAIKKIQLPDSTIYDLHDERFTIASPTDGQAIIYDSTNSAWVNEDLGPIAYIGLDESQGDIIDAATGKQVDVETLATKTWVENKNYLTEDTLPEGIGTQSDWSVTNTEDVAYIKNKPTIPAAPGTLTTTSSSSLSTASEPMSGTIQLHKISKTGAWADIVGAPSIPTKTSDLTNDSGFITSDDALPSVSSSDNGKILMVVNGAWTASEIQTNVYYAGTSEPNDASGNNGDIYLQTE